MFGSYLKISAYVDNMVLAAATVETITKPTGYGSAVITPNADVWIRRGGDAAVPAADVVDGTGSILVPAGQSRIIDFVDSIDSTLATITIISAGAALVSLEWFK